MSEMSVEPGMRGKLAEQQAGFGGGKEIKMENLSWAELDQRLRAAVEAKANGRAFDVARLNALVEERNVRVEEVKRLGFPGDRNKDVVANRQQTSAGEWPAAKQQFVGGGLPATDPIERFEADMDAAIRTWTSRNNNLVDNMLLDDPRLGGVVEAWVDGVKRTVEIRKTESEISARQALNMPLGQLEEDLRYLRAEAEILDWGGLRNSDHRRNVTDLVNASMDYERTAGANRADWFRAEKRAITPQTPVVPNRNMGRGRNEQEEVTEYVWKERPPELFAVMGHNFLQRHELPETIEMPLPGGKFWQQYSFRTAEVMAMATLNRKWSNQLTSSADFTEEAGETFVKGWMPLLEGTALYGGTFDSIMGDRDLRIPCCTENFDFKDTMVALKTDPEAIMVLEILMAMDGRLGNPGRASSPDVQSFLTRHTRETAELRKILYTSGKEYTHTRAVEYMNNLQVVMARELNVDPGTIRLMRTLSAFMGMGIENRDMRDILSTAYGDGGDSIYKILAKTKGEMALGTPLETSKVGTEFGLLAQAWRNEGMVGVIEMSTQLNDGMLTTFYGLTRKLMAKNIETLDRMIIKRADKALTATSTQQLTDKVEAIVGEMTVGKITLISADTAQNIILEVGRRWGENDRGKLAQAKGAPTTWVESFKDAAKRAAGLDTTKK